jgi:GTP-binding protein
MQAIVQNFESVSNKMKPVVAIVGRPNVGKSTLFNRIIGRRHAIVDDQPGVTRDRNIQDAEWCGREFLLVDTGGYTREEDTISAAVRAQALRAVEEADVIVFVCDVRAGVTDVDIEVAEILRKQAAHKKVFLAVNKVDSQSFLAEAEAFRKLGLGEPHFIAGEQGLGVAELLDEVIKSFPPSTQKQSNEAEVVKLAVVGRPNVGKSSFVNAVLGEERQIVTEIAGTTRDSIDTEFRRYGRQFILIDTAGLRKRAKVEEDVEFFSTTRTEKALERADVAIVIIDATQGLERQDMRIINMAIERKCGVLIAINKWDLIEKDAKTAEAFTEAAQAQLKALSYLPIITVSAVTKQRVFKAIDLAEEIWQARRHRIETSVLNRALLPEIQRSPPWSKSGKEIKVKYITQLATEPPLFALYASNAKLVQGSYKKYVERLIREKFGFKGVPIEVQFRQK